MNTVSIIGQLQGDPEVIYNTPSGDKKLYKLVLKVPRKYNVKGQPNEDFVNVKAWATTLGSEYDYFDQSFIGVEGRIASFGNGDTKSYINEVVATKVVALG